MAKKNQDYMIEGYVRYLNEDREELSEFLAAAGMAATSLLQIANLIQLGQNMYLQVKREKEKENQLAKERLAAKEAKKVEIRNHITALEKEVQTLQSNISKCNRTPNPNDCRKRLNDIISSNRDKVSQLKQQLSDLGY